MAFRNPPPEFPVRTYPSPNISDQVLIEWVTSELANSKPIEPGTPIDKTREFPGFKLGVQRVNPLDHNFTQRVWIRDATNEDVYNFALKYSGDNISAPVFVRTYREPKVSYTARTKGTALQTVYKLSVTNAGSGYIHGTKPVLTFSGGTATGYGIVAPDGTIAEFILTNGGSYGSAPTFTVAAPSSGTTATGTASIQPTAAVLVEEEALQFPTDSEFYAQYFNVVRVYETLPGPWIYDTRDDLLLGPVQRKRRAVLVTSPPQVATKTATVKTTYEAREGSSVVAWEIVETNSDGTGSAGNPLYPIFLTDFEELERGKVHQASRLVADISSQGDFTVAGGVATLIRYDAYDGNPALRKKTIETWPMPGPIIDVPDRYDTNLGKISGTRQLVKQTSQTQDISASGQTRYEQSQYGDDAIWEIIESWNAGAFPVLGPTISDDEERGIMRTWTSYHESTNTETLTVAVVEGEAIVTRFEKTENPFLLNRIVERSAAVFSRKGLTQQFGGSVTVTTTTISQTELLVEEGLLILDSKARAWGNGWIRITTKTEGTEWPTLYDYDVDPETGQTIYTTYTVVDKSVASGASSGPGSSTRYKHIDAWRSLEILADYSTPADYDEQRFAAHNFPALFDGNYYWDDNCGAIATGIRGPVSAMVEARTEISYTSSKQTISGLTLIPVGPLLLGRGARLSEALMDSGTFTYTGECTAGIDFPASDPDYSTYVGSIQGTEQLVAGESVRTNSGLYRNTKVYVIMI